MSVQSFLPVSPKRPLTVDEQRQVQCGRSRWFPEIFQGYGTPLPNMPASPGRQALLAGLGAVVGGGLLGANIGAKITTPHDASLSVGSTPTLVGGAAGALGLGGIAALVTYLQRQAKNDGVVDLMKRLPEGGTKRDLLSDPAVQADRQRDAIRSMYGNDDRFESRLPASCSRFG